MIKNLRQLLKRAEGGVRRARDDFLIRPLIRSKHFRRHYNLSADVVVLDLGTHRLAFDPNDKVIGSNIWNHDGWYQRETMHVFDAVSNRSKVFVDVGANIGTQTIYALRLGGFERAICFEPEPRNLEILRINLLVNGLTDRVTIIEAAAGAADGRASLSFDKDNSGGHSISWDRGGDAFSVRVVAIQNELARLNVSNDEIGLAWVDVEGHEGEVLAGWADLPGTPLFVEWSANAVPFPLQSLDGYRRWAEVTTHPVQWQEISTFKPADFTYQVELLFS